MRPFRPPVSNPDLLTIAASLWPRRLDTHRFPVQANLHEPEPDVRVLVHSQRPGPSSEGEVLLIHGLEGSSESTYMRGMAQAALRAGFTAHRVNLRGCGPAARHWPAMYHAGLTSDIRHILEKFARTSCAPVFVVGFSLGGNVALKLAGEFADRASGLLAGVCAVSAPIDLEASVRRIGEPRNRLYESWFLRGVRGRVRRCHRVSPRRFPTIGLDRVNTLFEFDDRFTAPHFGFNGALDYYRTQSAARFLDSIRVPTLLVQATDDPIIPFDAFRHPAIRRGGVIELSATRSGGHLGYFSWLETRIMAWLTGIRQELEKEAVV